MEQKEINTMKNKEDLIKDGYRLLGKYNEELLTYFKLSDMDGTPGVSYYLVDSKENVNGGKKFFTKREIDLAVNIHQKLASQQSKIFARTRKKQVKKPKK